VNWKVAPGPLQTYKNRLADIAAGKTGKAVSAVSAKRVSVLSLKLDQYKHWADELELRRSKPAARWSDS
jgi:hypothetical protein